MVGRCYYFVEDNKVKCKKVEIAWDCGFTKEAKREYINRILMQIPEKYYPAFDITTASDIFIARSLSPHILKWEDGTKFDQIYNDINVTPEEHDYKYLRVLSNAQIDFIEAAGSFTDVFHDPGKKGFHTQAHSAAVIQLLLKQGEYRLINDYGAFVDWWRLNELDKTKVEE